MQKLMRVISAGLDLSYDLKPLTFINKALQLPSHCNFTLIPCTDLQIWKF